MNYHLQSYPPKGSCLYDEIMKLGFNVGGFLTSNTKGKAKDCQFLFCLGGRGLSLKLTRKMFIFFFHNNITASFISTIQTIEINAPSCWLMGKIVSFEIMSVYFSLYTYVHKKRFHGLFKQFILKKRQTFVEHSWHSISKVQPFSFSEMILV